MKDLILPKGLRIEVVNNDNLTTPIGTKATLQFDERIRLNESTHGVFCLIDGESMTSMLPFEQCKIIVNSK